MIRYDIQEEFTYQAPADIRSGWLPRAGIRIHKLQNFIGIEPEPLNKQDTHAINIVHRPFQLTPFARVVAPNKQRSFHHLL
jgi:hypothetical protein